MKKVYTEKDRAYWKRYREKHKEHRFEYDRKYNLEHREQRGAYHKKYYSEHKEALKEQARSKKKNSTSKHRTFRTYENDIQRKMYQRADHMARNYRAKDSKKGYDISNNVTGDWIYENVFLKKCLYCNNDDWEVLGCDRIDNSKPHTPDNCVPCCYNCNNKRHSKEFLSFFIMSFMEHDVLF